MDSGLPKTVMHIFESTKPKQTFLLLLTMLGAYATGYVYLGSSNFSPSFLIALLLMGYLAVGGTTLLNMYFDVDIDSVMERTKGRPLPSKKLDKRVALACGTLMVITSLAIAWDINVYVFAAVLAGFAFDIFGYTLLMKRRSPLSIFVGAVAGSMPALGGWAAATGSLEAPAFLLASLVFLWQPLHVWFLSFFYSEDYRRARVPTLPLVVEPQVFGLIVIVFLVAFVAATGLFVALTGYGIVAFIVCLLGSLRASLMVLKFINEPEKSLAWRIFKFATPLLASVFLLIPFEAIARTLVL